MLSGEALALFRRHVERHGDVAVDDETRPVYRELARAGVFGRANPTRIPPTASQRYDTTGREPPCRP